MPFEASSNYNMYFLYNVYILFSAFEPTFNKKPLPAEMYGAVNGNITIECRPEAAPAPTIEWYIGGSLISSTDKFKRELNGDLVITGLNMADAGVYRCKATNDLGSTESAGRLFVKGLSFIMHVYKYIHIEIIIIVINWSINYLVLRNILFLVKGVSSNEYFLPTFSQKQPNRMTSNLV